MRKLLAPIACALAMSGALYPQAIVNPPSQANRTALIAGGWQPSKGLLQGVLARNYQPGSGGQPGSTGNPTYRAWLSLWKWCDLLSRSEKTEAARFLASHLVIASNGRPTIIPPGEFDDEPSTALSRGQAEAFLRDGETREKVLGCFLDKPYLNPEDKPIGDALKPEVLAEWFNDPAFTALFFQSIVPDDYLPAVLQNLQEIYLADPAKFREYMALAIAIAVVYDQNWPEFWPHRQVKQSQIPLKKLSSAEIFADWVKANEGPGVLLDLRKMQPEQIKFVVDAPLDDSEFQWARKNAKFYRPDFAKAFSSIAYDYNRMTRNEMVWPASGGPYTLENIREKGGICVDQAYFAAIAGKAKCLPTLYFSGQGTDGGHAWFGYMKSDDKWDMDCGRYENQNYTVGRALDPQTWKVITDHELKALVQSSRNQADYCASQDDIIMASLFEAQGNTARAAKAFDSAIQTCPTNTAAWDAKENYLIRSSAGLDQLKALHTAALTQFATDRDQKAVHQAALAEIARKQGDEQTAGALEKDIVSQNKHKRSDLSVGIAGRQLMALVDAGKLDDAFTLYHQQMNSLGRTGGGNLFNEVVEPFVEALVKKGDRDHARQAIRLARKSLTPESDSLLASELDELEKNLN